MKDVFLGRGKGARQLKLGKQLGEGAAHIRRRQDADRPSILRHDGTTVAMLCHRARHLVEGRIRIDRIRPRRHGLFDREGFRGRRGEAFDVMEIAIAHDAHELAAVEYGQVPNAQRAHHLVRVRQRLVDARTPDEFYSILVDAEAR